MDGNFVPNLTYGPTVIERLRELTDLPLDAHLMISDPARYLDDFLKAGCDCITFHVEAVPAPVRLLKRIREAGAVAGLAFNPGTPVEQVEPVLADCDQVLVMSVEPGFGGQRFIPSALDKLRRLKSEIGPETLLAVDGGIGPDTIRQAALAGAHLFVAGSAVFDAADYRSAIDSLTCLAHGAQESRVLEN
jgi:ribulose-phosphate 3-epimerase